MNEEPTQLFTLLGTPVTGEPVAVVNPIEFAGLSIWLMERVNPTDSWLVRLRRGGFGLIAYGLADLAHVVGHILSAKYAGAPMDQLHLSVPFPRTLYFDDDVSPLAHQLRAIGGPITSGLLSLLSLCGYLRAAPSSAGSEFYTILAGMNGFLGMGSLFPLSQMDGGALLKWELVKRGHTPEAAEERVNQVSLLIGGLIIIAALIFVIRSRIASRKN